MKLKLYNLGATENTTRGSLTIYGVLAESKEAARDELLKRFPVVEMPWNDRDFHEVDFVTEAAKKAINETSQN